MKDDATLEWENVKEMPLEDDANGKKLPPMDDDWFDGEKDSVKLNFPKCEHELSLKSAVEAKCDKCGAVWSGNNVWELVRASKLKTS